MTASIADIGTIKNIITNFFKFLDQNTPTKNNKLSARKYHSNPYTVDRFRSSGELTDKCFQCNIILKMLIFSNTLHTMNVCKINKKGLSRIIFTLELVTNYNCMFRTLSSVDPRPNSLSPFFVRTNGSVSHPSSYN